MLPKTNHGKTARNKTAAFTLLELVIVLALIAALAGVVALRSGKYIQRGQVTSILQLTNNLKTACAVFYADTSQYPREYDMATYSGGNTELSATQTLPGWDGPYIEKGITTNADNPFGALHLYDTSVAAGNTGFDLDADGTNELTTNVCTLYLSGITQEVAEKLDEHFDSGVGGTWNETGRFNWISANSRAFIMVYN